MLNKRTLYSVFAFPILFSTQAFACSDNDLNTVVENARWCKSECDSGQPGKQNQCTGSGKMSGGAASRDSNAIREGFEICHDGNGDAQDQMRDCRNTRDGEFTNRIRTLYGISDPVTPPPNPPAECFETVSKKFDEIMIPNDGTGDIRDVQATLKFDVAGEIFQFKPEYYRDDSLIRTMGLQGLSVKKDSTSTVVAVSNYDVKFDDARKHKYRIQGVVEFQVKKACP